MIIFQCIRIKIYLLFYSNIFIVILSRCANTFFPIKNEIIIPFYNILETSTGAFYIKIMHFAGFLRSILGMPTFREPCNPLYQGKEPNQAAPRSDEVDCKVHETLAFQEWIWTRRKSAKCIIFM